MRAAPNPRRDRGNHSTVKLDRHGTPQEFHGKHNAEGVLHLEQNTFYSGERTLANADTLSHREVIVRFSRGAGCDHPSKGCDFGVTDRRRDLTVSDDQFHAGRDEDGKAVIEIEPAEEISRK